MDIVASLETRDPLHDKSRELTRITTVLLILATLFVCLRFWARYIHRARYGADDWMIVAALVRVADLMILPSLNLQARADQNDFQVFVFASGALNYAGKPVPLGLSIGSTVLLTKSVPAIAHGLGRHANMVLMDDLVTFFKVLLAYECIYITTILLVKLSLLLMYRRLFPLREFHIYLAVLAAIVISWWIAIFAVCIFQCNPISKSWLPWIEGTCINLKASFIGNAIPNILTDVAILCMPIRPVWKLHATIPQRLSVCFIFLLGSL